MCLTTILFLCIKKKAGVRYRTKHGNNKDIWDKFVSTSPQRSIFVRSKFLDSLNAKYDLVTCHENNNILAGAVVLFSDEGEPINSVFPFTQYQGILLADNSDLMTHSKISHEFKVLETFIKGLTEKYSRLCFCQSTQSGDLRPFQWHNYHEPQNGVFNISLRYTGILDLKKNIDFNEYLRTIRLLRRREFKKASEEIEFKYISDEHILDDLHNRTFERQNIAREERESLLLKSITVDALKYKYGKLFCAYYQGAAVSSILFLYDDRTAYYLFGANHPEYRKGSPGTFLMLNLIKDCFDRGIFNVDFVGVNSPNRGDYKLSYNAELKPYFICSYNR
jgi:hypothetical protein